MPVRAKTATEGKMRCPFQRSAAISLALCAMVLRALLPDGWMPSAGAGSLFVICSADGTHREGKTPAGPAQERTHAPCAFAAAAPLSPPAALAAVIGVTGQGERLVLSFATPDFVPAPHFRPNAARAPPAFS
jgi:hypothetical protein